MLAARRVAAMAGPQLSVRAGGHAVALSSFSPNVLKSRKKTSVLSYANITFAIFTIGNS